jgi:hypothetical protein
MSTVKALYIFPTFPFLRRMDVHFSIEKLIALDQEAKKCGTLYGIPLNPRLEGYNEGQAKKAKSMLRAELNEYRVCANFECWLGPNSANTHTRSSGCCRAQTRSPR